MLTCWLVKNNVVRYTYIRLTCTTSEVTREIQYTVVVDVNLTFLGIPTGLLCEPIRLTVSPPVKTCIVHTFTCTCSSDLTLRLILPLIRPNGGHSLSVAVLTCTYMYMYNAHIHKNLFSVLIIIDHQASSYLQPKEACTPHPISHGDTLTIGSTTCSMHIHAGGPYHKSNNYDTGILQMQC